MEAKSPGVATSRARPKRDAPLAKSSAASSTVEKWLETTTGKSPYFLNSSNALMTRA